MDHQVVPSRRAPSRRCVSCVKQAFLAYEPLDAWKKRIFGHCRSGTKNGEIYVRMHKFDLNVSLLKIRGPDTGIHRCIREILARRTIVVDHNVFCGHNPLRPKENEARAENTIIS